MAELLDEAENVVPSPAVQARRMVAQFVKDLVHFEGSQNGLYQNGGPNGPVRNPQFLLAEDKHVVPEPGFQMAFHLRQIEIRTCAGLNLHSRVVEEEQAEVEQGARN